MMCRVGVFLMLLISGSAARAEYYFVADYYDAFFASGHYASPYDSIVPWIINEDPQYYSWYGYTHTPGSCVPYAGIAPDADGSYGQYTCWADHPATSGPSVGQYAAGSDSWFMARQGSGCDAPEVWDTARTQCLAPCADGHIFQGGTCVASGQPIPSKNVGRQCPLIGDPIGLGVGNLYEAEIVYKGQGGSPLELAIAYNSMAAGRGIVPPSAFGARRRSSYERTLARVQLAGVDVVYLVRPDGRLIRFNRSIGAWVTDGDTHVYLEQEMDLASGAAGWRFTTANDTVEAYDANGRLQTIQDIRGNTQTLHYNTDNQLDRVDASNGDYLTFQYDNVNRIKSVAERANRTWGYGYDLNNNLVYADNPDGSTRHYHYNEQAYTSGANLPRALTGITDPPASE